ncbi:uncharacterized protein NECHADRAFT_88661 [Fusarium vanettenii 77-13-4]|nr:uncharacterized protein NECHADRAFT_88661 [Fusarium vanettenii 77-13-4]EEU38466.1 hypothetical protein NECHADRAFT_88661 [Fusarium vanettenii 77-13-4]
MAYREENGRRYHALSSGNLQHELYVRTLHGELALCPKARDAKRVLDIGTGTGSWAIDYGKCCFEAGQNLGRPVFPTTEYKNYLAAAGFEELGNWTRANIAGGLDGLSLAYFTRGLGWTPEETRVFCAHTRKDMENPKIYAYWPIGSFTDDASCVRYFVYGRKPLTAE